MADFGVVTFVSNLEWPLVFKFAISQKPDHAQPNHLYKISEFSTTFRKIRDQAWSPSSKQEQWKKIFSR